MDVARFWTYAQVSFDEAFFGHEEGRLLSDALDIYR